MKTVLCFGEVLWDAFGDTKRAGGAPMNVARHLVQQHMEVIFASRVGNDVSGDELVEFLVHNSLFSNLLQHDEKLPTCEVTVQLDASGQATYIIPEPVSWDNIKPNDALSEAAVQASAVVFGSLACRNQVTRKTLLNLLDETRALKIFDINLRPPHYDSSDIQTLAAMADVIKMNEDEAALFIGDGKFPTRENIIAFQHTYHNQTICITRGGDGAMIWHNEAFYEHPGFKVDVTDTVGAGDSFLATLIEGLLNDRPMEQILHKACAIGAFVATQRGANPVYNEALIKQIVASTY
jgi:fructokinase